MKLILRNFYLLLALIAVNSNAQRVKVSAALGGSAYYGDLMEGSPLLKQVSPAFTLGGSYDFTNKIRARLSFTGLGIKASDKDNSDIKYKERNLDFSSSVWELSVAAEYDFLDNVEQYVFTPYVFVGPGLFHFNPTTVDRFGNKQNLRDWGTEGQGLAAFPDRKPYSLTQINLGFGAGVRVDLSENLQIGTEIFVRKTFTDYLDDVSTNGYVLPSLFISQGNAFSQYLAYRGDEVGKPFGQYRPRGNPQYKDIYYTFQVKLTLRLPNITWGGSTSFYGSNGSSRARRNSTDCPRVL